MEQSSFAINRMVIMILEDAVVKTISCDAVPMITIWINADSANR